MNSSTYNQAQAAMESDKFLHRVDLITKKLGLQVPQIIFQDVLETLPEGSFGKAVADFYKQEKIAPFTSGPRRKQLHDAVHVLTGYGTDPMGEAEVQAFLLGAHFKLTHLFIGGKIIRMLRKSNNGVDFQRLYQAYLKGRKSKVNIDKWEPELLWHLPFHEVQAKYNVM